MEINRDCKKKLISDEKINNAKTGLKKDKIENSLIDIFTMVTYS